MQRKEPCPHGSSIPRNRVQVVDVNRTRRRRRKRDQCIHILENFNIVITVVYQNRFSVHLDPLRVRRVVFWCRSFLTNDLRRWRGRRKLLLNRPFRYARSRLWQLIWLVGRTVMESAQVHEPRSCTHAAHNGKATLAKTPSSSTTINILPRTRPKSASVFS